MKNLWNIADLIDLHYFFQTDESLRTREGEKTLAKRDRVIYLAKIEPQLGQADAIPPRLLVRKWLDIRRLQYRQGKGHEGQVLPGAVWQELTLVSRWLFLFVGLFVGTGLAGSFLIYSGTAPLNVSAYVALFVLVQLLFLAVQLLLFLYRRLRRIPMESSSLYTLLGRLLIKGVDGLRRKLQRKMTGRQRLDLAALVGGIEQRKELAALLIWPAFLLMQLFGVGFNVGVLGVTLAKVVFSDIAFGWQSSLQLTAEAVAGLVKWIALPWSWAMANGYPSLEQIKGSQMVLKEGILHLETIDLLSWWPFLCCAVAVYGLLPRLLLVGLSVVQQRRSLERLHFSTLRIKPLIQRMTAPRIDTNGVAVPSHTASSASRQQQVAQDAPVVDSQDEILPGSEVDGEVCFAMIPDELYEDCPLAAFLALLSPSVGPARIECLRYGMPGAESDYLYALNEAAQASRLAGVMLLQEAWQPPLRETETFLRNLRQVAGKTTPLTILLVGKPAADTMLTSVDPGQLQVWVQKMRAFGDPCLDVIPLVQS